MAGPVSARTFAETPCVFYELTRSTHLSHNRTVILLFYGNPPDVLDNSPADHIQVKHMFFLNYSYLLNRNSDFNMLYMKID